MYLIQFLPQEDITSCYNVQISSTTWYQINVKDELWLTVPVLSFYNILIIFEDVITKYADYNLL